MSPRQRKEIYGKHLWYYFANLDCHNSGIPFSEKEDAEQSYETVRRLIAVQKETRMLGDVGRFHAITARDLAYLREKNLAETTFINARRDGQNRPVERIQVVTLTEEGRNVLLRTGQFRHDQEMYAGLVKPRETEHDAQVYRAYLKEWERIERDDGSNPRIVLDFELKADIQKAIHDHTLRVAASLGRSRPDKKEVPSKDQIRYWVGTKPVPVVDRLRSILGSTSVLNLIQVRSVRHHR